MGERSLVDRLYGTVHLAQVSWNGDSQAEVMVPGGFKRQLCGLCGNFNGFPQDDLRTRFGQITNSPAVFGNSWKVKIGLHVYFYFLTLGYMCTDSLNVATKVEN